jgi:hypothetical protein
MASAICYYENSHNKLYAVRFYRELIRGDLSERKEKIFFSMAEVWTHLSKLSSESHETDISMVILI